MRKKIQHAFDRIRLSDNEKQRIWDDIEAKAALRRARIRWIAGGAAAVAAAAVLTAALIMSKSPQSVADVSAQVSAQASGVAAAQTQNPSAADGIAGRIVLSINPSVEFRLGEDGMVVEVVGLNDDGVALIEGIDFAGLSLENATIVVVNRLIEQGYISASMVDDVYISVSGSTQPDTLSMMSTIIKTAASQYELAVGTVQTGESELQVVLGDTDEPTPTPETTPEVDATPGTTSNEEPSPTPAELPPQVTRLEYTRESGDSVGLIYISFTDGEKISNYLDSGGMYVKQATYLAVSRLIDEKRLTGTHEVVFDLKKFDEDTAQTIDELLSLIVQEAGLPMDVSRSGGTVTLTPNGALTSERTARYTMVEIDDPTVIKERGEITELQMQVLQMVYTQEEIDYMLTPRYWAVMPNLAGLTEARAVELLALAGLTPAASYEDGDTAAEVDYGEVFYQDYSAGGLVEVGSRLLFFVRAHSMPSVNTDDLPRLLQYLPAFLGEDGHATLTVDRDTGLGVQFQLRQEGWEVVVRTFGGRLTSADGSQWYNEERIGSGDGSIYWAADNGNGNDVPQHATLVYYIFQDGECIACVGVRLELASSEGGDTLTYEAYPIAFAEGGPYSYDEMSG